MPTDMVSNNESSLVNNYSFQKLGVYRYHIGYVLCISRPLIIGSKIIHLGYVLCISRALTTGLEIIHLEYDLCIGRPLIIG